MELPPDEELSREVYARFGLAYYMTECVHRALVHVFAVMHFGPAEVSRPRIEERTKAAVGMTLGELVAGTKSLVPPALHATLAWALTTRNYYAHGFWYERIHMMFAEEGKVALIAELEEATDTLSSLNQFLDVLTFSHMRTLGVTDEQIETAMRGSARTPVEPLPVRRVPRTEKAIQISSAWIMVENERSNLILQDPDGQMWQLCDVGLGWCYHEKPGSGWRPFEKLNAKLPASSRRQAEAREAMELQASCIDRLVDLRPTRSGSSGVQVASQVVASAQRVARRIAFWRPTPVSAVNSSDTSFSALVDGPSACVDPTMA